VTQAASYNPQYSPSVRATLTTPLQAGKSARPHIALMDSLLNLEQLTHCYNLSSPHYRAQ
jgi:hypothetical protein